MYNMSEGCCELNNTRSTQTNLELDSNPTSRMKYYIKNELSTSKYRNSKQMNVAHSAQTDLGEAGSVSKPQKNNIYEKYYDTKKVTKCNRNTHNNSKTKGIQNKKINKSHNVPYKEMIKNIALHWLQDLPVLSNRNDIIKLQKDNKINSLINEIHKIQSDINYVNCDNEFKLLINKYLDNLHICLTDTKQDKISFETQRDLLGSIKGIQLNISSKQAEENNKIVAENDKTIPDIEINEGLAKLYNKSNNTRNNNTMTDEQNTLDTLDNKFRCNICYQNTLQEEIYDNVKNILLSTNYSASKYFLNEVANTLARKFLLTQENNIFSRKLTYNEIQRAVFQEYTKKVFNPRSKTVETKDEVDRTNCSSDVIKDINQNNHSDPEMVNRYNEIYYNDNQNENLPQVAKNILGHRNIYIKDSPSNTLPIKLAESHPFRAISIYMSEDLIKYPLTSTPYKPTIPKDAIPKLNAGEISYMKSLADVIREWMKALPIQLDDTESLQFKEVIINDLAGNIVYEVKKHQLAPSDDLKYEIKSLIFLWLNRFAIYDNPSDKDVAIDILYAEIFKLQTPSLTLPQHGTRKKMKAIQFQEEEDSDPLIEYIPKGIDVIEDEISIWMNEQPEKIYVYDDRMNRNKMIHKLAEILEQHLLGKHNEKAIEKDVAQWLHTIIKPNEKEYIDQMIEELRDRVKNLPQEATLRKEYKERLEVMRRRKMLKENAKKDDTSTFFNDYDDPNETMKEFLEKFIQHNYDVDDSLARNAFSYLLKKELVRINPPTRKEIYEHFAKSEANPLFERAKFVHELEYIKLISDWLKRIPVTPPYNRIKNKHRIHFIHNLAKYITEIEEERAKTPDLMDYDFYLFSIIRAYIAHLPISTDKSEHIKQMNALIVDLVNIIKRYTFYIQNKHSNVDANLNNLGEFVNEFINEHGKDLRDDPLKLEVWMDRLMIEIQKLVCSTPDPNILGRSQLYRRLAEVPIPKDESIELFNKKLFYVKEITDWLKNLPLEDVVYLSEDSNMVKMITELTEKIIERDTMKLRAPGDARVDMDFIEFLKQWIPALPLDMQQEIVVPFVIQQLMNRIDKIYQSKKQKNDGMSFQVMEEGNKKHEKSVIKISPTEPKSHKNPENAIIEAVEKFCNALPIDTSNEDGLKARSTKNEIAKKILQKISKLNINPTIFNDELLFKEIFRDEIDMVLDNIPQDEEFQNNKEKLKNNLIDSVVELENVIKEQSAGENYKQKLENMIEASIPNPVQNSQMYDPGFEFYKNRLATMFILENFHHADEDVKLKYEKRIQSEVDKYFEYAQNKNAIPLSKDRIQNELYDALFKVPIPNEASVAGEVEEAKTRFEIDAWYELLPLIPANTLDELLDRDRVLSSLAKRIHEIEKVEKDVDSKIQKEIIKWLTMLPLLPGNEHNLERFANHLQNRLKSTIKDRKCLSKDNCLEIDKGKSKIKRKSDEILEKGQLGIHEAVNVVRQPIGNQMLFISQKPPADLILEVVASWCNQLPIISNTPTEAANARNIKDNLAIKIVLKISELNSDPEVFDDEYEYDAMLDQEIDKLTYNLPILYDYQEKEARKSKLKEQIRSIKPVILMERQKHEYKVVLEETAISFLEESNDMKEVTHPKEIIQNIVDDFLEYYYNKDDVEERNVHKNNMHETVVKNLSFIRNKLGKELAIDPFILRNELICKLSQVPVPSKKVLQNIITEIRMKKEVEDFFQKLSLYKQDNLDMEMVQIMKLTIAKRLCDLELNGHNPTIDSKMTKAISKYLKKLNINIDPNTIKIFVERLRNNEIIRKTPLRAASCSHDHHRNTTQNRPQIVPAIVMSNQDPSQIIPTTISAVPITTEPRVTRREMVIPPRDIPRLHEAEQCFTEASDDNKSCKCARRKIHKRKRVCIADRNFGYNHLFRRPVIPMWCRYPQFGFYFY